MYLNIFWSNVHRCMFRVFIFRQAKTNFIEIFSCHHFNRQKFGTDRRRKATGETAQRTWSQARRTWSTTFKGMDRWSFALCFFFFFWALEIYFFSENLIFDEFSSSLFFSSIDIHFTQREREVREARLLEKEIRAQERHHQSELKKHKEAAAAAELHKHATQVHTQLGQLQKHIPGTPLQTPRSPRESLDKTDTKGRSHHDSKEKGEALATTSASVSSAVCHSNVHFSATLFVFVHYISYFRIQKATHHTVVKRQVQVLWPGNRYQ